MDANGRILEAHECTEKLGGLARGRIVGGGWLRDEGGLSSEKWNERIRHEF